MIKAKEEYQRLHKRYIACLIDYHNAYLQYIVNDRTSVSKSIKLQQKLREMRNLSNDMIKTITEIRKEKKELDKEKNLWAAHRNKTHAEGKKTY